MKSALICGAGKIGLGFIGQLLHRSGYRLYFLDADLLLVGRLNQAGKYRVVIAGRPEHSETIPMEKAFHIRDRREMRELVPRLDLLVSAVGADNIEAIARYLAEFLSQRERPLNWLICENAQQPAGAIRKALASVLGDEAFARAAERLGLVETQVLRTAIAAEGEGGAPDSLAVQVTDWWTLPADADAWIGPAADIQGLVLKHHFAHELQRKLFTFNGLNGPMAYVGYANGYRILHEAARAPELQPFFREIMEESAHGLLAEHSFDPAEHRDFQRLAIEKYRDTRIEDTLERHARDTARKLGPGERLLGPAGLCLKHGRIPHAYAKAIAAAIDYSGSKDMGTARVQALIRDGGIGAVLRDICGLPEGGILRELIEIVWSRKEYKLGESHQNPQIQ